MKNKRMWHTAHAKEFVQVFDTLAARKGTWNVWQDFVFSTAIALSNYLEPNSLVVDYVVSQADDKTV